jgi:hypothetical protein
MFRLLGLVPGPEITADAAAAMTATDRRSADIRRPAPAGWCRSYTGPEPVQVEFLDSAGRRWTLDEQGTLARGNRDSQPAG